MLLYCPEFHAKCAPFIFSLMFYQSKSYHIHEKEIIIAVWYDMHRRNACALNYKYRDSKNILLLEKKVKNLERLNS